MKSKTPTTIRRLIPLAMVLVALGVAACGSNSSSSSSAAPAATTSSQSSGSSGGAASSSASSSGSGGIPQGAKVHGKMPQPYP